MELVRVDASFCTFFGVHSGLAMGSIYLDGSEEQKRKWLPAMARWEKIGCSGLTEPLVGSGTSGGMTTTAKRDGDGWVPHSTSVHVSSLESLVPRKSRNEPSSGKISPSEVNYRRIHAARVLTYS